MKNDKLKKMIVTGLMAALCYVAFTFLKIPIPAPGGQTALHIGNAFCVLASLMLGGVGGGLAGAIGMTLADLFSPAYITSAPKTFIMKFCIGLVAGLVAHRLGHIAEAGKTKKEIFKWTLLSCLAGFGFNVLVDPIVGYFYKNYVLGIESSAAKILSVWSAGATFVNAVVSTALVCALYMVLRPALIRSGLFPASKKKEKPEDKE